MRIKKIFLYFVVLWSLFCAVLLTWNINEEKNHVRDTALYMSRSYFQLIVVSREWNAMHGGVLAPASPGTPANQYLPLEMRTVALANGEELVRINPAYMTRQLSELTKKLGVFFRITSLKPIRPENGPSAWEEQALQQFESGSKECSDFVTEKDGGRHFRYMAPLKVVPACLKCHAGQGYKVGDIRGGISIELKDVQSGPLLSLVGSHLLMLLAGAAFIAWCARKALGYYGEIEKVNTALSDESRHKAEIIEKLELALSENRSLKQIVPICAWCKKIRTDQGAWDRMEKYIQEHSQLEFSHGICPECYAKEDEKLKD
ncbi:MAG: DUF3365 domain-containing protein [Deltaproteobacteria bacterium]|nr:DUF3365 domain-containing protein [Deltaproteobacteria bacterium]